MPKRVKADRDLIFATYDRLKNGAETARQLGLHYNTVADALRRRANQCIDCHARVRTGDRLCKPCRARHAERMRRRRAEAARSGKCSECGKARDPLSRQYCPEHRIAFLERSQEHAERKRKRGTPQQGIPSAERRSRYIKKEYGDAGIKVWRDAGGRCAVCAADYADISVQLHHIACDKTNTEGNLICLCVKCHQATHKLLALAKLPEFLDWFHATYPGGRIAPARKAA